MLNLGQTVLGLDNFSTGKHENLEDVQRTVEPDKWRQFQFKELDIRNLEECVHACKGVDYVLHQAALGSVPRSIDDVRHSLADISRATKLLGYEPNYNVARGLKESIKWYLEF